MAADGDNFVWGFPYTGAEDEIIPQGATRIFVLARVILGRAFEEHPNIIEVICHENVEKIEPCAFCCCPRLRRVIMPGVKVVGGSAFWGCNALEDVECGKLEIIEGFGDCKSLRSINLPSARIVKGSAFFGSAVTDVTFGSKLERFERGAFINCTSLERITIPLKDGLITSDDIFQLCGNLRQVDLVEGELHENIAALQLEEWRTDMNKEIDSINRILPNLFAGEGFDHYEVEWGVPGEKAQAIRTWIRSVLRRIVHYRAEHRRVLSEAATLLELAIWKANLDDTDGDRIVREGVRTTRGSVKRARRELCVTSGASIVIKNVLPFLELKS